MPISRKEAQEAIEIIWKHFDTNNNNVLDPVEVKELLEFVCRINESIFSDDLLETLYEEVDKNQDGKITKEELIEMLVNKV